MDEHEMDMRGHAADMDRRRADIKCARCKHEQTWGGHGLTLGEHCVDMRGQGADMGRAFADMRRT